MATETVGYYMSFRFEYGPMDDGTVLIRPPSGNLFNIDQLTLRVLLELNSGSRAETVLKKYGIEQEELDGVIVRLSAEKAVVHRLDGHIGIISRGRDISLVPAVLLIVLCGLLQVEYFKEVAVTFLMRSFRDAAAVGGVAVLAVLFHETGHYLTARRHFRTKFGFTLLGFLPGVYVDTQQAWSLCRNRRILISMSGIMADMLVNCLAAALAVLYPPLEYFVTPFLLLQYTRMIVVLNPLFSGDGYWILSDAVKTVNLTEKSYDSLLRLRPNLLSLFGLLSIVMMLFSAAGLLWYVFNLSQKLGFFALRFFGI